MDLSKARAFVEHPGHGLKMIYLEEREDYLKNGWHKPGEKLVAKNVVDDGVKGYTGEDIEDEKPEKSLDEMTKDELNDFAARELPNLEIKSKMSAKTALNKIKKALNDNSAENNRERGKQGED
jgi:hypothetical protein